MLVQTFNDADKEQLFDFLQSEIATTDDDANANMWHSNWQQMPNTLPYILCNTDRFSDGNGAFHLIIDQNKIVAMGGVQIAHFNNKIAMAGIRTWVKKTHRNKMLVAKYILPTHKDWAIRHGCKQVALSFNEYNKNLTRPFTRVRAGESGSRISKRTPDMMFYNGVNELDFKVCIQYTPQWVIYERLDPDWEFNWRFLSHSK